MDFAAAKKVASLIGVLTDAKSNHNDNALKQLKVLLRGNDELVRYAQACLMDRLGTSNSQARKLALELCDILFSRCKAFRHALTAQFTQFVELTVGHKADKPLPPPAAAAVALRDRALELIEKWHETWSVHYPQVTVAYKFLKKQYTFPDISSRAAAAAAEQAARQQRHQQMLLARYQQFRQDFPQQRQQFDSLLQQMQGCFELLQQPVPHRQQYEVTGSSPEQQQQQHEVTGSLPEEQQQQHEEEQVEDEEKEPAHVMQQQQQEDSTTSALADATKAAVYVVGDGTAAGGGASLAAAAAAATLYGVADDSSADIAAAGAVDNEVWEDVQTQHQQLQQAADSSSVEVDFDMDELVGEFQQPTMPEPDHVARAATLREQLSDLAKQAHIATTSPLLDWLRLLTQLQLQDIQQQQERQRLLRAVVDLRSKMQAYIQQAADWGVKLGAGQTHQEQTEDLVHSDAAKSSTLAAAIGDVTHEAAAATAAAALDSLPSRSQLPLQIPSRAPNPSMGASTITFAGNLQRRLVQAGQQRQQQQAVDDVYANLRDPTAAVVGAYTIPMEVVQRHEESRWHLRHSSESSEGEDDKQTHTPAAAAAEEAGAQSSAAASAAAAAAPSDVGAQPLQPSLRAKLLASAPKLPVSGTDWLVAHKAVAHHGMELYNHWGAVDAAVTIPQERLQQLVGYAATYYKPSKKSKPQSRPAAAAAPGASIQREHGSTTARDSTGQRPDAEPSSAAIGHCVSVVAAAAAAATADDSCGGGKLQSVQQHTSLGSCSRPLSAPAATAATGSAAEGVAAAASAMLARSKPARKRGRKEESSAAHNRQVLASALANTDECMAAALQQQLNEEAAAEAAEAARAGRGRGRGRKAPERKGDLVRRKLLGLK